jgi:O-antigen/teichoic acid export membrane protein
MGEIRKQTIYSSVLIYIGFFFGLINQYLLTRSGNFSTEQYGLFQVMFGMAQLFIVLASFGLNFVLLKFYHFYQDNLNKKENDLFSWIFILNLTGFIILLAAGYLFEPLIIRKFSGNAALLVQYYGYIFPLAFGLQMFTMLEGFFWCFHKTVISNFLKETVFRFLNMLLIIATVLKFISYHQLVMMYSFIFLVLALVLLVQFIRQDEFNFTLKLSRVSRKFYKKIFRLWILAYSGQIIRITGTIINSLIISSKIGLGTAGIYAFAEYLSSLIQAPQRSIEGATVTILSRSWKDKNIDEIKRLYHRSSINMLLVSLFLFLLIWLNYDDAITTFQLNDEFRGARNVLLLLGLYKIIDMGTGVNAHIIVTSNYWGFEFITDILLLSLLIALNFFLIPILGITGSALAVLISYSLYNFSRFLLLYFRFRMQPFSIKHLYAILLALISYIISFYTFRQVHGFTALFGRSILFIIIFVIAVFKLKVTPDADQLLEVLRKRWKSVR